MDPETIPRSTIILPIEDNPTDALPVREALAQASCPLCTVTHGGHIWGEAEPGKEATFFLSIPDRR
jgi:hypothetical protein